MSVDKINVEESIQEVKALMGKEGVSPAMKSAINVILLLVQILINRLGLDSKNSSKPPSSDQNREKKKRASTGKKPGGQNGHIGKTLEQVETPDEVEVIPVDRTKLPEGEYTTAGYEARQVFDVDISVIVKEYRAEILKDKKGNRFVAKFPDGVTSPVQYGNGVKAQSVYLSQYQLLPYNRVEEYFSEQIGLPVSVGTINNFNQRSYELLESFESSLKRELIKSKMLHADETGINIEGKRCWLHVNSNTMWTYLYPHKKRGREAMNEMGVLPYYRGNLCHDHWKPYYGYEEIIHDLCNAHHLRELERVWEQDKQRWGKTMIDFLLALNLDVVNAGGILSEEESQKKRAKYREILQEAEKECPPPIAQPEGTKKRGRQKRSTARNLLERLQNYEDDTLRFMVDKEVPFSNNLGERDIRMTKVQQKISGCFRSYEGAKTFCRIRSYLASARKQNIPASVALQSLFDGTDIFAKVWT